MDAKTIKPQIKKIADEFNLSYSSDWFAYLLIPIRMEILTEYTGLCPDPIYQKYGKTGEQRIKNINKFVISKDFKACLKRYGGQVVSKKDLFKEKRLILQIKDEKLRNELLSFQKKLKSLVEKTEYLALLTIPRNKKEEEWQLRTCLRHEWIHILLDKNGIRFQEIHKKYWPYDEGINEYLGAFVDNSLSNLEKFRDKEKYPLEHKNWVFAIKFRELLKNADSPKERKIVLKNLIKNLTLTLG